MARTDQGERQALLITTVTRTYKREHLLARAIQSVLDQGLSASENEIVVINDSGQPLSPAEWQSDERITIYTTHQTQLCFAGNLGVSVAKGRYVHYLDDDDVLLPGAYKALLEHAESSNAVMIYGAYEGMDDDSNTLFCMRPAVQGRLFAMLVADGRIPLGCALIKRDAYIEAGGFDPVMRPAEDAEFLQRLSLLGEFEYTDNVIARFRVGPQGATTCAWEQAASAGRLKREKAFWIPNSARKLASTIQSQETRGELVRYYGGSALRHIRAGSLLIACSRLLAGARLMSRGLFSREFWAALIGASE